MAFRNVCSEPLISSTNGSLTGYLRDPHSTACSRMWAIPLEALGGVKNVAPKTLFSSPFSIDTNCAPVRSSRYSRAVVFSSGIDCSLSNSKPCVVIVYASPHLAEIIHIFQTLYADSPPILLRL